MSHSYFFQLAGQLDIVVLGLLLLLSVWSVAIILERFFFYRPIAKAQSLIDQTLSYLYQQGEPDEAEITSLENQLPEEERQFLLSLRRFLQQKGRVGFEEFYNMQVTLRRKALEKHLGFLATIGANAPYIGLLGTVLGIMKAFHDLSQQAEAGVQTVMAGISGALLATGAGLFVAIPAVLAYNAYQKRVKSYLQSLGLLRDRILLSVHQQS